MIYSCSRSRLNALTIDVEDYFHVSAFEKVVHRDEWDHYESRVVSNTYRILNLLDRHQIKATFFVLGWVAQRFAQLVRDIHDQGHEIGSHGYWHQLVYQQTPDEFRTDLIQSREVLEKVIGEPVISYRAPSFSITNKSLWALEILVEEGFQIDTSIYPIFHDRYGIPNSKPYIHKIQTPTGCLWEFPVTVYRVGPLNLPVSGGGYFRFYPLRWTLHSLSKINNKLQRPFVFYVHPWELDAKQPRLQAGSALARLRHYMNLRSTEQKLQKLFRTFRFTRVRDVVEAEAQKTGLHRRDRDVQYITE